MSKVNISHPKTLRSFVEQQTIRDGYNANSEYMRELILKEQDRPQLLDLLLSGAVSAPGAPANATYFESLRDRVCKSPEPGAPE